MVFGDSPDYDDGKRGPQVDSQTQNDNFEKYDDASEREYVIILIPIETGQNEANSVIRLEPWQEAAIDNVDTWITFFRCISFLFLTRLYLRPLPSTRNGLIIRGGKGRQIHSFIRKV